MSNRVEIVVTGRNTSGQAMDSAKRQAGGLGDSVKRVGEIAQGIIAADMFQRIAESAGRFLGQARTSASDLGESVNAVQQVFGDHSSQVLQWGRDNATAFGLSERAFNQAVTPMGAVLSNTGMALGEVTDSTLDLTARAADMASVFNTDVETALNAIGSGLRGETEPLRQFGVTLSAAAVEARALADTGKESAAALTEQEKAAARVALILEQTNSVANDFANTSDSLANSQRILNAEMETAQATVGNLMVPALEAVNAALIPMVQAFNEAPAPIQVVVGGLVLLGAGILTVTSRVAPMVIAMHSAGISMQTLAVRARTLAASFGPISAAVTAFVIALQFFQQEAPAVAVESSKLAEDLERLGRSERITGELAKLLGDDLNDLGGHFKASQRDLNLAEQALAPFVQDLEEAAKAGEDADAVFAKLDEGLTELATRDPEAAAAAVQLLAASIGVGEDQLDDFLKLLPGYSEEMQRAGERTRDAAESTERLPPRLQALADAFGVAGDEAEEAVESITSDWQDAADDFVDSVNAMEEASADLREDQKLTADMLLEQLQRQIEAQDNWQTNMIELAQRVPPALHDELAKMGPDGAEMVQLLADMTDAELAQWVENMGRRGRTAGGDLISEVLANFVAGAPALRAVAEQEGEEVADRIAEGMRQNGSTVEQEARRQGLRIRRGVGGDIFVEIIPQLRPGSVSSINRQLTAIHGVGARQASASGGLVGGMAAGGVSGVRGMQTGGIGGAADVVVGEHRPELAQLPFGTRVVPSLAQATDRNQLAALGAGVNVNVNLYAQGSILSERELIEVIRNEFLHGGFRGAIEAAVDAVTQGRV